MSGKGGTKNGSLRIAFASASISSPIQSPSSNSAATASATFSAVGLSTAAMAVAIWRWKGPSRQSPEKALILASVTRCRCGLAAHWRSRRAKIMECLPDQVRTEGRSRPDRPRTKVVGSRNADIDGDSGKDADADAAAHFLLLGRSGNGDFG